MAFKNGYEFGAAHGDLINESLGLYKILANDDNLSESDWGKMGRLCTFIDLLYPVCYAQLNAEKFLRKYLPLVENEEEKFKCMKDNKKCADLVIDYMGALPKILDGAGDYRIVQLQTSLKRFSRDAIEYLNDPEKKLE